MPSVEPFANELSPVDFEITLSWPNRKQRLPILHWLPAGSNALDDLTSNIRLDLVHQLHRFNDAQNLSYFHLVAHLHKGRRARRRRLVEGPHDRRLHLMQLLVGRGRGSGGMSARRS